MPIHEFSPYCKRCGIPFSVKEFGVYKIRDGQRFYRHSCKECEKKRAQFLKTQWDEERRHEEKKRQANWSKAHNYNYSIKKRYGLSKFEYENMVMKQKGLCALCGKPQKSNKRNGRLSVDHDHKTGKVRGLLCVLCNIMLGRYEDSVEKFENVVRYLKGELQFH